MSDELRAWLEDVKVRLKDAHLGGLGARDAVGEDALQADNTAKLVYGDLPALIAKVEEMADLIECKAMSYGVCSGCGRDIERYDHAEGCEVESALRAPGGGARA